MTALHRAWSSHKAQLDKPAAKVPDGFARVIVETFGGVASPDETFVSAYVANTKRLSKTNEVYFEVKSEMGIPVAHGYGMTECPMIVQGSPTDTDEQLAYTEGAPVYRCEITIVRADGTEAPSGEEGEVRLAGPMLFKGYTDDELNKTAFDELGRFRTGDLGVKHPDGHVTLTGRLKDVIIRKGENISAKEIEDLLHGHPAVQDVAVIGLPDPERGERVCAVVEQPPGAEALTLPDVTDWLRAKGLSVHKLPERLEVVDALPRNDTLRKVLKYKLRERFA